MRIAHGSRSEILAGVCVLAGIVAFVFLALAPLLHYGGSFSFNTRTAAILRFTLFQAVISTALSVFFGLLVALSVARRPQLPGRTWLVRFMAAPMGLPALAAAFGILAVWGRQGVVNDVLSMLGLADGVNVYGLAGILLAHTFFNIPLAARLFVSALDRTPPQYWLISANLGMGPLSVFRFVEGPVVLRALPGVAGLIFMLCATSFTLVLILGGGPAATTLEVAIYQALRFDFDPGLAVFLVVLQIVLTAVILAFLSAFPAPAEDRAMQSVEQRRFDGTSTAAKIWDGVIIALFAVFCGAPFIAIFADGITASFGHLLSDPLVWRAIATSLSIGLSSALLAVILTYMLSLAACGTASRSLSAVLSATGSLILMLPPVVLATGWFLRLKGGGEFAPFILVAIINALMALPFSTRALKPAMVAHFERTGRLSEALNISGLNRFLVIDIVALKKQLLMAFFFALSLSLGDLGAMALFGGDNLVTLPWLIYARLGSYRTTDAAALTLILTLVCMSLAVLGTPSTATRDQS
jgi:thiamine transport system permease protein